MNLPFILGWGILASSSALANNGLNNNCVKGPQGIGLFGSTQTRHHGSYTFDQAPGLDAILSSEPSVTLFYDACKTQGKFLTLLFAPDEISVQGGAPSQHYTGELSDDNCSLKDSPFPFTQNHFQRAENYRRRTRFIRNCVKITVSDLTGNKLDFPAQQPFCRITRVSASSAQMSGGVCYFKSEAYNRLSAEIELNPSCTDPAYLKKNHIDPQEVMATLKSFISGDASGNSEELLPIGSNQFRVSLDPDARILPISEDKGPETPRWPTQWSVDTHFGRVKAKNISDVTGTKNATIISIPLFLENSLSAHCADGLCWSSHFYSTIQAGELSLSEIRGQSRKETLLTQNLSFILNPQWQGQAEEKVSSVYFDGELEEGKSYEFEFLIGDVSDDFSASLSRSHDRIGLIPSIQSVPGSVSLPQLSAFPAMGTFKELPQNAGLVQLDQQLDPHRAITESLQVFKSFGGGEVWPPTYDQVCNPANGVCIKPSQRFHTRLSARFTVLKKGSTAAPDYVLGPQETRRESSVFPGYVWPQSQALPRIECVVKPRRAWYPPGTPKRQTPTETKKGARK